jgi:hypothetical protein
LWLSEQKCQELEAVAREITFLFIFFSGTYWNSRLGISAEGSTASEMGNKVSISRDELESIQSESQRTLHDLSVTHKKLR